MSKLRELHQNAMSLADKAQDALRHGETQRAEAVFLEAFALEYQAAQLVIDKYDAEPTRAILFSSAASLAYQGRDLREAERMICFGLSGNPPAEIARDMRDLLEKVNFGRHLELRGEGLASSEIRMAIAGKGVSFGVAPSNAFAQRLQLVEKMLTRTAERIQKIEFRPGGQPRKLIRDMYSSFVQVPQAASFAITFRLGEPTAQQAWDDNGFTSSGAGVVNAVMSCLGLFDKSDEASLRAQIPTEEYYNNFVAIAQQIAPDGQEINMVGFTAVQDGRERQVLLTRTDQFLPPIVSAAGVNDVNIGKGKVTGQLRGASSRTPQREAITIVDKNQKPHPILVPSGVSDIVKPLWEEFVVVETNIVKRAGKRVQLLQGIRPANESEIDGENASADRSHLNENASVQTQELRLLLSK